MTRAYVLHPDLRGATPLSRAPDALLDEAVNLTEYRESWCRELSRGQTQRLVLAKTLLHDPPLLLLDDVLAELDPQRQLALLEAVGDTHQCLVSATHLDAFEGEWRQRSQILNADHLRNGLRNS